MWFSEATCNIAQCHRSPCLQRRELSVLTKESQPLSRGKYYTVVKHQHNLFLIFLHLRHGHYLCVLMCSRPEPCRPRYRSSICSSGCCLFPGCSLISIGHIGCLGGRGNGQHANCECMLREPYAAWAKAHSVNVLFGIWWKSQHVKRAEQRQPCSRAAKQAADWSRYFFPYRHVTSCFVFQPQWVLQKRMIKQAEQALLSLHRLASCHISSHRPDIKYLLLSSSLFLQCGTKHV